MKKTPKGRPPLNLLDLIPQRNVPSEQTPEGFLVLLKPKFSHPLLVKHIVPRMKKPYFKIKLDEKGSFIWKLCDGKTTVKDIGLRMREEFGDSIEPLYDRLGVFLQTLEKSHLISFKNL